MPRRSKINTVLTPEDREELNRRIVEHAFGDYTHLTEWLAAKGYRIGRSAVASHGQNLERKLEAIKRSTEQAKAIVAAAPDDEGAMNDALIRLIQQIDFDILRDLDQDGAEEIEPRQLSAITRSVASLARAQVQQKRWMLEAREKLTAKVGAAQQTIDEAIKSGGLSDDAAAQIRNALLDIRV